MKELVPSLPSKFIFYCNGRLIDPTLPLFHTCPPGCVIFAQPKFFGGSDDESDKTAVKSVSIKLPDFYTNDPALWFSTIETHFEVSGIKVEKTKFLYVVQKLPQETASMVRDLIVHIPSMEPYTTLKNRLIAHFATSSTQKMKQALDVEQLGDQKPSHLLLTLRNNLQELNPGDELRKELFLQKMPNEIKYILAASKDLDLEQLAGIADRVHDSISAPKFVNNVSNSSNNTCSNDISQNNKLLDERLSRLEASINKLTLNTKNNFKKRNFSRSHSRNSSTSRRSYNPNGKLCFYHFKFGNRAQKCNSPCAWVKKSDNQKNE